MGTLCVPKIMLQKYNTSHFDIKEAQKIISCIIDFYMIPTSVSTNKIQNLWLVHRRFRSYYHI